MANEQTEARFPVHRIVHVAVMAVLVLGGLYYIWTGMPAFNKTGDGETRDARKAEALALV